MPIRICMHNVNCCFLLHNVILFKSNRELDLDYTCVQQFLPIQKHLQQSRDENVERIVANVFL